MTIQKQAFGKLSDGTAIDLYSIKNSNGVEARITNWGAILVALLAPDRNGQLADITVGHDNLAGLAGPNPHFGAVCGRYANRIGKGKFRLNGREYTLATNNGANHLHGGKQGFDKRVWQAHTIGDDTVALSYLSKDGEEGYPGNLWTMVTYTLTDGVDAGDSSSLVLSYVATTDQATVLNITNHVYFNLSGAETIHDHVMQINASTITATDSGLIPTGALLPVKDTPLDFTQPHKIGERINQNYAPLVLAGGYDHNYVIDGEAGRLNFAARASEATTGRVLEVFTDQPGIQLYTGNFLDGTIKGKGRVINKRAAFCLETQHFPDSPNQPHFPSTVLKPGETFASVTVYRMRVA
jgi:aldose 1-epimerase